MDSIDVPALVIESINEVLLETSGKDQAPIPTLNHSTRLIGRKGILDSLGLVSAIVNIEQKLSDDYDILVTIADDRAMSQEKSPFRSLGSLAEYISLLIDEQNEPTAT
jgi:acyl carrier protein